MLDTVLLQDGGQIALGHIVFKRAIAEDCGGLSGRALFFTPLGHAQGQVFGICYAFDAGANGDRTR